MDRRRQRISERAYALWEREGRPEDRAEYYWHVAEAEIDQEMTELAGSKPKKVSDAVSRDAGKTAHPSSRKRGK